MTTSGAGCVQSMPFHSCGNGWTTTSFFASVGLEWRNSPASRSASSAVNQMHRRLHRHGSYRALKWFGNGSRRLSARSAPLFVAHMRRNSATLPPQRSKRSCRSASRRHWRARSARVRRVQIRSQ